MMRVNYVQNLIGKRHLNGLGVLEFLIRYPSRIRVQNHLSL